MSLVINPETKIGALLDAYPLLEETLIALAPTFAKLKNPILRKTVAKVATLEQAAAIGGLPVRDLVRKLREAAGQPSFDILDSGPAAPEPAAAGTPAWLQDDRIRLELDADRMLQTGEHPIGKIRQFAATMNPGDIIKLTSSFRPAPLIETMRRAGLEVHFLEPEPGRHLIFFCRPV